jgi:hypothetical protein
MEKQTNELKAVDFISKKAEAYDSEFWFHDSQWLVEAFIEYAALKCKEKDEHAGRLARMVLDHFGSQLREDCIVSPDLNSVAVQAVEVLRQLKNEPEPPKQ